MTVSRHYTEDRTERQMVIDCIGEGTVVYTTLQYDEQRGRTYRYEITDNAILIVKDERNTKIITKMIARPSRIRRYWADAPQEIIMIAVKHTRAQLWM